MFAWSVSHVNLINFEFLQPHYFFQFGLLSRIILWIFGLGNIFQLKKAKETTESMNHEDVSIAFTLPSFSEWNEVFDIESKIPSLFYGYLWKTCASD